jgi:DNA-binding phage protein
MAITSQNNAVYDNMRYALEQYREFIKTGHFMPKVYGANGQAVQNNLARFNFILDETKGDLTRFHRLMTMKLQMRDLKRLAQRYDINLPNRELMDEEVYGSMLFGPKVGNGFLQNLLGNHKPITIDLWFMRTWGRYTGTILKDQLDEGARERLIAGLRTSSQSKNMSKLMEEFGVLKRPAEIREMDDPALLTYVRHLKLFWEKLRRHYTAGKLNDRMDTRAPKLAAKNPQDNEAASALKQRLSWPGACEAIMRQLGSPVDSPKNASTRAWIRSVCTRALEILKVNGFNMTAANLQASLWFPEKELYGKLTGRSVSRFTTSYDDAIIEIARKEGISNDAIDTALRSVGANGNGRHPVSSGDEQSLAGTDVGLRQRVA